MPIPTQGQGSSRRPVYVSIQCGHCEQHVSAEVVFRGGMANKTDWLLCPVCGDGSVLVKHGSRWDVYPKAASVGQVPHLPDDVDAAWREARVAFTVAAYTASEVMCRKILMHVAVDKVGAASGLSFKQYVEALDGAGYIAVGLKPIVDSVRDRGNIANHELPPSEEADATTTLRITEHLLHAVYALPGLLP